MQCQIGSRLCWVKLAENLSWPRSMSSHGLSNPLINNPRQFLVVFSLTMAKKTIWHQLWHIQTVADCQDGCRRSKQFQTVKTVADCQGNCIWLQTFKATKDSCRLLQTCLFLSFQLDGKSVRH